MISMLLSQVMRGGKRKSGAVFSATATSQRSFTILEPDQVLALNFVQYNFFWQVYVTIVIYIIFTSYSIGVPILTSH
jgi:hypothetical protein